MLKTYTFLILITCFASIQRISAQDNTEKVITQTTTLHRSAKESFALFTNNMHLEQWLCVKADVQPKVWGKYELFWDADDLENNNTLGCKVLAIQKSKYINFEWKAPAEYKEIVNKVHPLTNVTIILTPRGGKHTQITLLHIGWKDTPEWEEARLHFAEFWRDAFDKMKAYSDQKIKL